MLVISNIAVHLTLQSTLPSTSWDDSRNFGRNIFSRLERSIVLWRIPTPPTPITPSVEEFFDQMKS